MVLELSPGCLEGEVGAGEDRLRRWRGVTERWRSRWRSPVGRRGGRVRPRGRIGGRLGHWPWKSSCCGSLLDWDWTVGIYLSWVESTVSGVSAWWALAHTSTQRGKEAQPAIFFFFFHGSSPDWPVICFQSTAVLGTCGYYYF